MLRFRCVSACVEMQHCIELYFQDSFRVLVESELQTAKTRIDAIQRKIEERQSIPFPYLYGA